MRGLIVKGIGGFYYVKDMAGNITQSRARGIFKNEGMMLYVGDEVEYEMADDEDGIITKIYERKNEFIRPPIANVDTLAIVISAAKPKANLYILDKFLVMAEKKHTNVIICINKCDVADAVDIDRIADIYTGIYDVVKTSGKDGQGIAELKKLTAGKRVAFAGPSGVGKSTLLNKLDENLNLETGAISKKTKRGKHTTRHVEIFETSFGALIYDTPGFTSFDIMDIDIRELADLYPDIARYKGFCKFDDCIHINEPDCSVLKALEEGKIKQSRFDSYKKQIEEIKGKNR